jgi:nicotinate-nucleotide adenylyltransferase
MAERKIALFGGTFDPIHLGHTTVAAEALEAIDAEKLIFMPAKRSPLKGSHPKAGAHDRFRMIALAIAGHEKFELSNYELNRPEPSYTLDTVRHFQAAYKNQARISWLLGADSIDDLPYWYRVIELIDECNVSTMYRAGSPEPDFSQFEAIWGRKRVERLQRNVIRTSLIDISSTQIRKRLACGGDVSGMLHPDVADYIRDHHLYSPHEGP